MSIKTGRKLGFIASLTMVIGTVVGIGIFLKNNSILKANDWSGVGTLVSWIIGGILALAAAISFAEIGSLKSGKTVGLADWAEKSGGKKFGYLTRFNFAFFYFGILITAISIFASETLIGIFTAILSKPMPHFGIVALVAVILLALMIAINYYSLKAFGTIQIVCTVLKFIPLALVAILGIVLATTNNHPISTESGELLGQSAFTNGQAFDITKVLTALPAVLFAYDAFLTSSAAQNRMKKPQQLPLVIAAGMVIVIVLYTFIAIAAILHGSGLVSGGIIGQGPEAGLGIFDQVLPTNVAKGMGVFIIVMLFFSTYGVMNGVGMGFINSVIIAVKVESFFGSPKLKKRFGKKSEIIYMVAFLSFLCLMMFIPAIITNNDAVVDAFSNYPTLFFFGVYAIVILLYKIKRHEFNNKKINSYLFGIFSTLAIIGITFVVAYQIGYGMTIQLLQEPNAVTSNGLFANGGTHDFTNIALFGTFIAGNVLFFGVPVLNAFLIKKFEKRDPFASTQIAKTK